MKIPADFIKQVSDIDIIEVADTYFPHLMKMGGIYQTNCMHEGDKTPSLTFFPSTNTFHCFGCGAGKKPVTEGASVIDFVRWMDNLSFVEAVEKLAKMKDMQMPTLELTKEEKERIAQIEGVMQKNRMFWSNLVMQERVMGYLLDRGIGREEINKWRIGSTTKEHVLQGHTKFHNRIAFPIINEVGKSVGFSYRKTSDIFSDIEDELPKYINDKSSSIFDKGAHLHGLFFVKKLIREKDYVIVGEGYCDAIIGQKMGLPFVSTMGTALTDKQIVLLKKYTNNVILWMDGDKAGIKATMKHAVSLEASGFHVKIINIAFKDPDDVLLEFEKEEYTEEDVEEFVHTNSFLYVQFFINQIMNRYNDDVMSMKLKAATDIRNLLSTVDDKLKKKIFLVEAAQSLGISEDILQ